MNKFVKIAAALTFAFSASAPALAHNHGHEAHAAMTEMAEGEIKKVSKDTGKITIRHGELKNLNMPAMTMVFRAGKPAMLDQVKAGDKVKFVAEKVDGAMTIVQLENVK
ncbi:MAG: copper-binding protein [Telluria sp.]